MLMGTGGPAGRPYTRSAKDDETPTLRRSLLLGGVLAFWMVAIVARLYYLQIIQYVELLGQAQRQQQRTVELAPQRGAIFDREMRPLAMSLAVDSVFAVPAEIPDRRMVANLLAPVLGLDAGDLWGRLNTFHSFCWVKRKVSIQEAARVRGLNLKGIYFQKEMKRFYPKGELAADVLGYVGLDDNGLAGLEYAMNEEIRGRPEQVLLVEDARRHSFGSSEREGAPGRNVVLTLDENIQFVAEKALAEAVTKWHATGGTLIMQKPDTGEILAVASQPSFNPNEYAKSEPEVRSNRAIAWVYEPGSTFKLVTLSAALEEKLTNPEEIIDCQLGSIVLAGHVIHDHKRFGSLTVRQVLVESSDVGAVKLGLRLGEDRLYHYIRSFGFGSRTEIELPGEEHGLLKAPDRWSGISIGEMSMGQEVGVTALQLVTAYSAIANGGFLFQPHIVRDVFPGNAHDSLRPAVGRRVVSERTAATMKELFMEVVEHGTGVRARLNGYSAGGKTGTAQKIDPSGSYSRSHYVSSFVGFAPVRRPELAILVVIDSPVGAIYGGQVAAPVFKSVAEQTLSYLNVPQDGPSQLPQAIEDGRLKIAALKSSIFNHQSAIETVQPASYTDSVAPQNRGSVTINEGPLLTIPDFSRLAERRVADECQQAGLELNVSGSGLAVQQNPPPGAKVTSGTRIWVRFAR